MADVLFRMWWLCLHVIYQSAVLDQNIYSDKARYLYDFWGPGKNMSAHETAFNIGLFYLLWMAIMYEGPMLGDA